MVKSDAERQHAHRRRLKDEGGWQRLNLWIKIEGHSALRRLAARDGVTIAEMIEQLAIKADAQVMDTLSDDKLNAYFRDSVMNTGKARRRQGEAKISWSKERC